MGPRDVAPAASAAAVAGIDRSRRARRTVAWASAIEVLSLAASQLAVER
ncbi:MAG: hypothetical protein C0P77_015785 [Thermoanaerobacterales bacterium]